MNGPIMWLQRLVVFGKLVDSFKSLPVQKRELSYHWLISQDLSNYVGKLREK